MSSSEEQAGTSVEHLTDIEVDGQKWPIVIDPAAGRIEARIGEHLGFINFHQHGSVLSLIHTETPLALRGKGVGDALAQSALEYARGRGMRVKPFCPFVAAYIRRHREYESLIDSEF